MSEHEARVRQCAVDLHQAVADAKAAGYRVDWPGRHEDLPAIAISETSVHAPAPAAEPVKPPAIPLFRDSD